MTRIGGTTASPMLSVYGYDGDFDAVAGFLSPVETAALRAEYIAWHESALNERKLRFLVDMGREDPESLLRMTALCYNEDGVNTRMFLTAVYLHCVKPQEEARGRLYVPAEEERVEDAPDRIREMREYLEQRLIGNIEGFFQMKDRPEGEDLERLKEFVRESDPEEPIPPEVRAVLSGRKRSQYLLSFLTFLAFLSVEHSDRFVAVVRLSMALEGEGIPVYITSKTGYFAATEVQELLQLLRVLDNPSQDIPLFGVMKSLFGGFSEEEAAIIRSGAKDCSLYEALKRFAKAYGQDSAYDSGLASEAETGADLPGETIRDSAEKGKSGRLTRRDEAGGMEPGQDTQMKYLGAKTAAFLHRIREYRSCTVYLPIRELLTKLIGDFGYLDYVTALPAGSRRRANVEMLLTKASDFERTSYFGLFHFIRYMEQLEKYDVDSGGAELLDENADVVRIMSIHKSKGLEFPITFVAGLSKRFNMQDVNQALILDMDLGLATDYVDPGRRIRNKTLRRAALSGKLREESLSEELRLLYVAMTRAREKLIMTGVTEHAAQLWEQMREAGY